jgi:hypothetical protein
LLTVLFAMLFAMLLAVGCWLLIVGGVVDSALSYAVGSAVVGAAVDAVVVDAAAVADVADYWAKAAAAAINVADG